MIEKADSQQQKWLNILVRWLAIAMSLFQMYTALFGNFDSLKQRTLHLFFGLVLTFLVFRPKQEGKGQTRRLLNNLLSALTLIGVVGALGYILINYEYLTVERFALVTPLTVAQIIFGVALVVLVLEATRRVVGLSLFWVVIGFLVYVVTAPYLPGILHTTKIGWSQIIDYFYLGTGGIFGIPLGVSSTDIALFIVFGAFMVKGGVGNLLFDVGAGIAGKSAGGIGKVAVLSSALMGMITGSGTANVTTVGSLTIPAMKKAGYKAHFAAAIEAAASTGGQIMPPVMGATAFVIAAFTGIPYLTITIYAIVPALLYFASIYFSLDLEAKRESLAGFTPERTIKESLKSYGHTILPIFSLIYFMIEGYSPSFCAAVSILVLVVISWFRPAARLGFKEILDSLESGAKSTLVVVVATAAAGIIVGSLDMTGLGSRFSGGIMEFTHGNLLIGLILTMFISTILGMGMPTTPAYVLQVALVIPSLMALGLPLYIAHFFAFYFSCLSLITPPVAITAYAAAGIAQAGIWETGITAFRIVLPSYIIPFAFAYSPTLLLQGSWQWILINVVTAFIGVFAMDIAMVGYWRKKLSVILRLISAAAGIALIAPWWQVSLLGLIILVAVYWLNGGRGETCELSPVDGPSVSNV